jgi:hypothetical protein
MLRVSLHLGWAVVVTLACAILPCSANAQFITRWVDANGVITFSTSSPPPGVKYEAVPMPSWRRKGAADTAAPEAAAEGLAAADPEGAADTQAPAAPKAAADPKAAAVPAKVTGPAQVNVQGQATTSLGETQWLLAGKVKNDGGAPADGVGIRISVFEDGQGNPCLEDRGTVSPATLQPGDTGTFELRYDSPCFFGSPRIDIVAEWQK